MKRLARQVKVRQYCRDHSSPQKAFYLFRNERLILASQPVNTGEAHLRQLMKASHPLKLWPWREVCESLLVLVVSLELKRAFKR